MARWLPSLSAALVAVAMGAGCDPNTLPGTSLGTYSVTGTLTMNSCGAGAMAPDPWTFSVQMSEDGSTLYWSSESEGQTPLSAPIDASSRAILTSVVQQNVDGTAQLAGPCLLERDDTIDLTLGSGSPPPTFSGTITYTFLAAANSDCGDQLSVTGGPYDTLPCTIEYAVTGASQ
jgi:hypothetical protein